RADVEARRLEHVRTAAAQLGATVLLKGSTTVIAPADGRPLLVNPTGTGWLATAGTGDVLAGTIGGLLAQGMPAVEAAAAAVYLHAAAGELLSRDFGDAGGLAGDLLRLLPEARREILRVR
ncbi:MAG TPA: NAD(P)H-hydrate dehydratase, partial [Dehalococcoidia bacterium]|nr:NAD(P)H-hydrate dehydratase [Dehalococcoidia bacterium]